MIRFFALLALPCWLAGAVMASAVMAQDCGGVDAPCRVAEGVYHIALPEQHDGPIPVVLHIHGYGASGAGVMGNKGLLDPILARGYALIAPTGLPRMGSERNAWDFFTPPRQDPAERRDDAAFLLAVLDDAVARFGLDRSRVLLSGFSIGGSMVWRMACEQPEQFSAFAPVSGGFWRPFPEHCAGPVKLFHTHGWRDQTVPLEGRPLRGGEIQQGDVFEGMQTWRAVNGCGGLRADEFDTEEKFWRRRWTKCAEGTALEFALHKGGHEVQKGWGVMVLDWFELVGGGTGE